MTNTVLAALPISREFDNYGVQLGGGLLYTYAAGSSTPQPTYQDLSGLVQNSNPIQLDSTGRATVRYTAGQAYKLVLTDPTGSTVLWSLDNYYPPPSDQGSVGALLYPKVSAESAVSVTNYAYPVGDVHRYGALGDGATLDYTAIAAAFTVAVAAGGGTIVFHAGGTYNLGSIASDGKTSPLLSVTGLSNCVIKGNGATILTNTNAFVVGAVLGLVNPNNVTFYDLNFYDTGFDQSQIGSPNFKCSQSIFLSNTGSTNCSGVTLFNCQASNTGSLLGVWNNSLTSRISNINMFGCRALNCFYGANFQQQGDDVTIQGFYVLNPIRAYFPYGVTNHSVDIVVRNDGNNANAGSNALCDIKRYDLDTKEIKLRLAYHGSSSIYGSLVNLEANVTSNSPAVFDGIDIDLRLADSTVSGSSVGYPVQFRDVTSGSVAATTATVFKRISLRGDVGAWPATNANNPIQIASVPNSVRGQLAIPAGFFDVLPTTPQVFPGFALQPKPNIHLTTMQGDLTVANTGAVDPRSINLTAYTGSLFALRVTLYAEADYTIGSTQQCYRRYLIFGHNSAGTVTIQSTNVESTYDAGAANTVTVAASGNLITFAFSTYTSANAYLRLEVEHLSKFL